MRRQVPQALAAVRLRPGPWPAAAFAMDATVGRAHSGAVDEADRRDIQATLAGDGEAYARLVRRYQDDVAQRMWRFTRDRGELEELVHDVFVEAYFSLKGFRGTAPLLHWLCRIGTRVGCRFWKTQRREASRTVPLEDWDGFLAADEEAMSAEEAGELAHNLLAQLPPRDRLVLTLLYLEELSVAQAAERTGWSRTMVKVQAYRARKKLRALLEKTSRPKT